jgi:hypothetical protein
MFPLSKARPGPASSGRPAGSASGLAIARSARAILGPRGRTVKLTNQRVTHADEWRRPVQERPDGVAVSSGECGRPPGEGTQHVIVPAGRKRELQPGSVNDVAGALPSNQLSFEQVLFTPAPSRDGCHRTTGCALCANSPSRALIVVANDERTEPFSTSQFHPPSSSCSPRRRASTPSAGKRRTLAARSRLVQ